VQNFTVSPAAPAVVYGVSNGTLYRSNDAGNSFEPRSAVDGYEVVVDPTNASILYDVASLRRSNDGGASWKPFGGELPDIWARMLISPANPSDLYLFAGCSNFRKGGVFVSHDSGDTWRQETPACTLDIAVDPLPPNTRYQALLLAGFNPLQPTRQIVADARTPTVRYGLPTNFNYVLVSDDSGASWHIPAMQGINAKSLWMLALDGDRNRLFLASSAGPYVSPNGGASWAPVPAAPREPAYSVRVAGDFLYVGTPQRFYRAPLETLDSFTPVAPLPAVPTSVRGIAVDPHTPIAYATADVFDPVSNARVGTVWRTSDAGAHWDPISGDDNISRAQIAVDGAGDVYALYDLHNGATTPLELFHYDASTGKPEHFVTDLELPNESRGLYADPHRRGVLYTTKNALLYTSTDGGHTWQKISSFNDGTKWIAARTIAFDPNRADVIYVTTDSGLYRTTDNGVTWSALDSVDAYAIAVAPSRSATLYKINTYPSALVRSDDAGATWRQLPLPPGASFVSSVSIDPINADSVWVCFDRRLYQSTDGGVTWTMQAQFDDRITGLTIENDGQHMHVTLDAAGRPAEWDLLLRDGHRRAGRK